MNSKYLKELEEIRQHKKELVSRIEKIYNLSVKIYENSKENLERLDDIIETFRKGCNIK